MRALKRQIASVTVLGVISALAFAGLSFANAGPIEPSGITAWSPNSVTINAGESVSFNNSSGTPHGVTWTATSPSSCTSTILEGTGSSGSWNGSCTFNQGGTFTFRCTVHPAMTGTVTVSGPEAPSVTTEPATSVTETGATLNGKVNPHGEAATYWFKYGTTESYDHETTHESAGSGSVSVSKSAPPISGLSPETTYHFRMFANNGTGTTEGADRTFRTSGPGAATTEPATGVGDVQATLVGKVNPNGQSGATYFFNWGTSNTYGHSTPDKSVTGTSLVTKTEPVTGLTPETEYHFQVVLKYGGTEVKGVDKTFTTLSLQPPSATTGSATGVTSTGATLNGTVNPNGHATSYVFEIGETEAYGALTSGKSAGSGTSAVAASATVTGLNPETTYHFRLVAEGSTKVNGNDVTFKTGPKSEPPPEEEHKPPVEEPKPPPPPPVEPTPPDTKIAPKPPAKTHDRTPTIKFKASVAGASFQCSVDSKPFKACRSPFTAPSLKPGKHRIRVKAVAGGVSDPTPASCSFKVLAKKKRK
jgi:plastocyanin